MVGRKKITLRLSISTNIEMRQSLRQRVCVVNHCLTGIIPPLRGAAVRLFFQYKKRDKSQQQQNSKESGDKRGGGGRGGRWE